MVGAGLAGLACARHLTRAGVEVTVREAEPVVGGRVRTDAVDGMLLDRGFQVHNTGYPEAARVLDHAALDLQPFVAGALLRRGDRLHRLGDPRRVPSWAVSTALAPIGSLKDKLLVAATATRAALARPSRLLDAPETTTYDALRARGLSDAVIDRFLRPFLSGVFLETELDTSSHVFDMVWRSLARGTQCLPAAGMQAIPAQLAAWLPAGTVELSAPVGEVGPGVVDGQRVRAVVVATDPGTAGRLLPGLQAPAMNGVTTHYHLAPEPPVRRRGDRARRRGERPGRQHGPDDGGGADVRPGTAPGLQLRRARRRLRAGGPRAPGSAVRRRHPRLGARPGVRRARRTAEPGAAAGPAAPPGGAGRRAVRRR